MFDIERVRTTWQREAAAIDALVGTINELTATEPIRHDSWTAQDLLGHIANAARAFLACIQGQMTAPFDVDAANEQQRQRGRQHSWPQTVDYWQRTRDEVAAFLASADSSIGQQPATLPWMPQIKTAGEALRVMMLHTRSHRQELEQGFSPAQA